MLLFNQLSGPRLCISIKGLDGAVEVVVVANPESLDQVHIGEQIVVTLIDVVAIALDKEGDSE